MEKTECRMPNAERNPNIEFRMEHFGISLPGRIPSGVGSGFGFRTSFGIRISEFNKH